MEILIEVIRLILGANHLLHRRQPCSMGFNSWTFAVPRYPDAAAGGRSFGDGHKQSFPGRAPEQFNCIGPRVSVVLFLLPKTPQPSELDFGQNFNGLEIV
jgi:hypothetical protein